VCCPFGKKGRSKQKRLLFDHKAFNNHSIIAYFCILIVAMSYLLIGTLVSLSNTQSLGVA